MTGPIESPRNPRIAAAAALRRTSERRKHDLTLLEGPHVLAEAAAAGAAILTVFARADDAHAAAAATTTGAELVVVSPAALDRLAPTTHPRGPIAVCRIPSTGRLADLPGDVLVAWGVADPGNVGTLIRSAAAFGLHVAIAPGTADPWSPKVIRSAAGLHFRIQLVVAAAVEELRTHQRRVIVATASATAHPETVLAGLRPVALVIGNEAHGVPPEVANAADAAVAIPMRAGVESVNAAVAGSILGYVRSRLRSGDGVADHDAADRSR